MSLKNFFATVLVAALVGMASITPSHSVDVLQSVVYTDPVTQEKSNWLMVHGQIVFGDGEKVIKAFKSIPHVGMIISGPGGVLDDGLKIAEYIHKNKLRIMVPPKAICASACAMMAFASPDTSMHLTSRIGLHRAFTMEIDENGNPTKNDDGQINRMETEETRAINLVLTIKFERWGMPMFVMAKWLSTNPLKGEGMFWITAPIAKTENLGIRILLDPDKVPVELLKK
jgi:membrane-bound ClpP family serine protease